MKKSNIYKMSYNMKKVKSYKTISVRLDQDEYSYLVKLAISTSSKSDKIVGISETIRQLIKSSINEASNNIHAK